MSIISIKLVSRSLLEKNKFNLIFPMKNKSHTFCYYKSTSGINNAIVIDVYKKK